jgi:hypothetical protein
VKTIIFAVAAAACAAAALRRRRQRQAGAMPWAQATREQAGWQA